MGSKLLSITGANPSRKTPTINSCGYTPSEGRLVYQIIGVEKSTAEEIPPANSVGRLGITCASEQRHNIAVIRTVPIPIQIIHSATAPAVSMSSNVELTFPSELCANSS